MKLERIVVGVDFSESSIETATWIAQHFARGVELVLLHVLQVPEPPAFLRGMYPPREQLIESARAGAEQRLRELSRTIATGLVWTEVREGRADDVMARVVEEFKADLVVVGAHGERPGLRTVLGTTAERVLRHSTAPVLVVNRAPAAAPTKVLAAIDESDAAVPVLRWAGSIAEHFHASLTALHVFAPVYLTPMAFAPAGMITPPEQDYAATEAALRETTRDWLTERLAQAGIAERATIATEIGFPADGILTEASRLGSDLIVLGTHAGGRVRRALLGSVAERVLRSAPCPVLAIVPPVA